MQKNKKMNPEKLAKTLKSLRTRIDAADKTILTALGQRFKAVGQVGRVKRAHDLPLYQKARWEEVVQNRLKLAKRMKVGEEFTRALLKIIHKEAIRIQKMRQS